jgi:hypothetical protein
MNIEEGFQIEFPKIFVGWGISESELRELLEPHGLRHITTGYYVLSCKSLDGLIHELGFHFLPRSNGVLTELEFFRSSYENQKASFDDFQEHFERAFGKPTKSTMGNEGFPKHTWDLNGVNIVHFVFDRFGPEEHMRIRNYRTIQDRSKQNSASGFLLRMRGWIRMRSWISFSG